jgi:hypothetical protein
MSPRSLISHPAAPYVAPFAVFMALLVLMPYAPLDPRASLVLWLLIPAAVIVWLSRDVLEFTPAKPLLSVLLGIAVFVVWIAPDVLLPGWRGSWLFQNSIVGRAATSLPPAALQDPIALALRTARRSWKSCSGAAG